MKFKICGHYGLQTDDFSLAILKGSETLVHLEDAINNML